MKWKTCPSWPEYDVSEHGDIRRTVMRSNRGERQGRSVLTESQVVVIKRLIASGRSNKTLAANFNVAPPTINSIRRGDSWAWMEAA